VPAKINYVTEPKPTYQHGGLRPGAGRKKELEGSVTRITISLSESQHEHLTERAAQLEISVAELIRRLIAADMAQDS
jgi:hypothetical protein